MIAFCTMVKGGTWAALAGSAVNWWALMAGRAVLDDLGYPEARLELPDPGLWSADFHERKWLAGKDR